jgi:hypothetical protein
MPIIVPGDDDYVAPADSDDEDEFDEEDGEEEDDSSYAVPIADPRTLTVSADGGVTLASRGPTVWRAGRWQDAIAIVASEIGDNSPIAISAGDGLVVADPYGEHAAFVNALCPTRELAYALDEIANEHEPPFAYQEPPERDLILVGNSINGCPWGWHQTTDGWVLLPEGSHQKATRLIGISFQTLWQEAIMTSGCDKADSVSMSWKRIPDEGVTWHEVRYDSVDAVACARRVIWRTFDVWTPFCVFCDDWGWVVDVDVSPSLPADILDETLKRIWRPCEDHARRSGDWTVETDDHKYCWRDGHWTDVKQPWATRLGSSAAPEPPRQPCPKCGYTFERHTSGHSRSTVAFVTWSCSTCGWIEGRRVHGSTNPQYEADIKAEQQRWIERLG